MYQNINYPEINSRETISLLKDAYLFSCKKDIEVLKPGNVYIGSPHKDTNSDDYIDSSIYSCEHLFLKNLDLGDRILF